MANHKDSSLPVDSTDEDPALRPFAPGTLVGGKYVVDGPIAEGGIGVVVAARHVALEQRVAIKHLKPQALGDVDIVARFAREGKVAAQLHSDHVVRVHDVGRDVQGGPYIVMEFLVGADLSQLLEGGPLPIARAVDYVLQACDALAEAHGLGIVHRDIKPDNLFVAERAAAPPVLKIIDFGISKVAPKRDHEGRWAHETATNERFGTPIYMSPEALRSTRDVDARTDIWSLGVVLHELLTGERPFDGADIPTLCTSILTKTPRTLRSVQPNAPEGLEVAILKCLEKDSELRFGSVAELAEELLPYGPPGASARVRRIRELHRCSGQFARPPTPMRETTPIQPLPVVVPPAPTPAPDMDDAMTVVLARPRLTWPRMLFAAASVFAVGGIAVATTPRRASTASIVPVATTTAPSAAPVARPTPEAVATLAPPASSPDAPKGAPSVVPPPSRSIAKSAPPFARAPATPTAAAVPAATSARDARALFGERQ